MRILDSVELWEKRGSSNGYFEFLEEWIGDKVEHDDKMNYAVKMAAIDMQNAEKVLEL